MDNTFKKNWYNKIMHQTRNSAEFRAGKNCRRTDKIKLRKKSILSKLIRSGGIVFLTALAGIIVGIDIVYNYHDFNIRADKR